MKMHVLTATVLAALASRAVLAASEGGDTWSAVEPVQQPTYSVMQSAPRVDPAALVPDAAFEGSEGGDTWSRVVPQFQGQPMGSAGLASGPRVEQR
jgi:hypothetical protein